MSSQEVFAKRKFFCWISKSSAWKTRTVDFLVESSWVALYIRRHGWIDPKHSWKRVCHDKISLQEGSSNQTNYTVWRACFRGEVWRKSIQTHKTTECNLCFQLHQVILKRMLIFFFKDTRRQSYVEKNVCAIFSQLHRLCCFFAFLRKLKENLKWGRRYWLSLARFARVLLFPPLA